jgi:hypothetical protein
MKLRFSAVIVTLAIALDDMATAPLIYESALQKGIGAWLPL